MNETLKQLTDWYAAQCNGDWEHQYGVRIDTLDNPGWTVSIDLEQTELVGKSFEEFSVERSETDWVRCRVAGNKFEGFAGLQNLEEALRIFLQWAQIKP